MIVSNLVEGMHDFLVVDLVGEKFLMVVVNDASADVAIISEVVRNVKFLSSDRFNSVIDLLDFF